MPGREREELLGEIRRDDEGRVALPRLDLVHGLVVTDELPVKLVVAMQLVDDHLADVDMAGKFAVGTLILIHDANVQMPRALVGIPESKHVVPGIERRQDEQRDDDHHRGRNLQQAQDVAFEYAEYVLHGLRVGHFTSFRLHLCR